MGAFDSRKSDLYLAIEKVAEAYFDDDNGQDAKDLANDFFDQFSYLSEPGLKQFYYDLNPEFWQWVEKLTGKKLVEAATAILQKQGIVFYKVYKEAKGGRKLVLEITNVPGLIVSTAMLPPGGKAATNPFLSASSYDAAEEDALGSLLRKAKSFSEFMLLLQKNGFIVEKEAK
jgi:hypothetical protein